MKILALADEPSHALWDFDPKTKLADIDLILSCGDLPAEYLEYLTNFTPAPVLYVPGNHDGHYQKHAPGGCDCIDGEVVVWHGLRIAGLGGSIRYNTQDTYQYTEAEMQRRVARLCRSLRRVGGMDILVTHSPAHGLNDQNDPAHRGFACFNTLLDEYTPQWFVHGHVHLRYDSRLPRLCTHGTTTVINASERYSFEVPARENIAPPRRSLFCLGSNVRYYST